MRATRRPQPGDIIAWADDDAGPWRARVQSWSRREGATVVWMEGPYLRQRTRWMPDFAENMLRLRIVRIVEQARRSA